MAFISILENQDVEESKNIKQPDFFVDLNLDQIIAKIQEQSPDYPVREFFYGFPTEEAISYRQDIYQDIKRQNIYESFVKFSADMRRSAEKELSPTFSGEEIQGACWQVESAYYYCSAILGLQQALEEGLAEKSIKSQGLQDLNEYLKEVEGNAGFVRMQQEAYKIWEQFTNLRFTLEIAGNKVRIAPQKQEGTYEDFLQECFQEYGTKEKGSMHSPFVGDWFLTRLERKMLQAFFSKYPDLEKEIIKFADNYQQYKDKRIIRLENEVQFYLAYYRFQTMCIEQGATFVRPTMKREEPMQAEGVYDLALACVNYPAGKVVVCNDFRYGSGEQFFVVNGPNQGGKTTFARSLGQLVYFAKIGLDVNAKVANVYYFDRLVTHFSVEESMESGQGKLMEELRRLAPIMNNGCRQAFVIINELFTTAAHYDGCIMGAKVLEYFIDRECYGIYVTHLRALGDEITGVVRMAAMLDGTKEHRRTFRIERNEAVIDGYAEDIIGKYQLNYECLHTRLKSYIQQNGGD